MNAKSLAHPSRRRAALTLLGGLFAILTQGACGAEDTVADAAPRIRKNVKDLTAAEKQDYVDAILKLKSTPSPYSPEYSYYDQLIVFHREAVNYSAGTEHHVAHAHPSILPWHRKMVLLFEDALREVSGKDITVPYWDWTDPESTQAVFSESFMGTQGDPSQEYALTNGPFRKDAWAVTVFSDDPTGRSMTPHPYLVRATGHYDADVNPDIHLPTTEEVETGLRIPNYDVAPWNTLSDRSKSFRNYLEGFDPDRPGYFHMHNMVHTWVAGHFTLENGEVRFGTMAAPDISPNDPVFFVHHANVDRVWAQWEELHPGVYTDVSGHGSGRDVPMYPFSVYPDDRMSAHGLTPEALLDIQHLGYAYE